MRLKKQEKDELIQHMIGELLYPEGFEYKESGFPLSWYFDKRQGDFVKEVIILEPSKSTLNFMVTTNNETSLFSLKQLEPEKYAEFNGFPYNSRKSYIEGLEKLRKLIKIYGLPAMGKMENFSTEERVRRDTSLYIWEHKSEIVKKREKEWGLEGREAIEQIDILSKLIEEEKDKSFKEAEPVLADIAAVYGELVIREYGGQWYWSDFSNNVLIRVAPDLGKLIARPLTMAISQWKGNRGIRDDWKEIGSIVEEKNKNKKEFTLFKPKRYGLNNEN